MSSGAISHVSYIILFPDKGLKNVPPNVMIHKKHVIASNPDVRNSDRINKEGDYYQRIQNFENV